MPVANMKSGFSRRKFLRTAAALPGASETLARAGKTPARPNIVWIVAEDIGPDLGCYGDVYARTPILDKLAGQGLRYTHAFSVSGVCAPSRCALATGMYPTSIGAMHMRTRIVPPADVKCFTESLRAAGYYCANNGKTDYQFEAPFTAWDHNAPEAHWRNRPDKNQPFFAVFNHRVSHESQIRVADAQYRENTRRLTPEQFHDPGKAELPPYYPDTPLVRKDWARYADNVTAFDYQAGDILRQLDEDGLGGNTAVFVFGDHGRGLPRAKRWIYDSGIRVPLVVRWPGHVPAGAVSDRLVSFVDFGPTVLSIAGIDIPERMQGVPFLGGRAAAPRKYIYAARDRMDETYDLIRAVRGKKFKYIRNYQPEKPYAQHIGYMDQMPTMREWRRLHAEGRLEGPQRLFFQQTKPLEELYDTEADPHEIRNLAGSPEYVETLEKLRREHLRWTRETGDLGHTPEAAMLERMRPGGRYAATERVRIVPDGGRFPAGSARVRLECPTEGASIAYTTDPGRSARWLLYTGAIELTQTARLRAKAIRYGYRESKESSARFELP